MECGDNIMIGATSVEREKKNKNNLFNMFTQKDIFNTGICLNKQLIHYTEKSYKLFKLLLGYW